MANKVPYRLKFLKVQPKDKHNATISSATENGGVGQCTAELKELLTCWRSSGVDSKNCLTAVAALFSCSKKMKPFGEETQTDTTNKIIRQFLARAK